MSRSALPFASLYQVSRMLEGRRFNFNFASNFRRFLLSLLDFASPATPPASAAETRSSAGGKTCGKEDSGPPMFNLAPPIVVGTFIAGISRTAGLV